MRRISLSTLKKTHQYDRRILTAVRIENGDIYFLGWLEDAEDYNVVLARKEIKADLDVIMVAEDYISAVTGSDGWQLPLSTETIRSENPIDELLQKVEPFHKNGAEPDEDDYEIMEMDMSELSSIIDALRDGDYIFVLNQNGGGL